jgi:hypothetical protein
MSNSADAKLVPVVLRPDDLLLRRAQQQPYRQGISSQQLEASRPRSRPETSRKKVLTQYASAPWAFAGYNMKAKKLNQKTRKWGT